MSKFHDGQKLRSVFWSEGGEAVVGKHDTKVNLALAEGVQLPKEATDGD